MSYPGAVIRGSYYLTIVGAPVFTLTLAAWWTRMSTARGAMIFIIVAVIFCLVSALAWLRVRRGAALFPETLVVEAPVVSALVAFTSILGTLTMLVTLSVLFDPRLPYRDVGGPLLLFMFLTMFLYGFALIVAEWVLPAR